MDMRKMMKQAQMMQRNIDAAQKEIAEMEYEAQAGGGMVKVTVTGDSQIKDLEINKMVVDPDDVEMLQDLVIAAVNEAIRGMAELSEQRMSAATGGMNIPGLM